jgi:membrane-bound lytic murein transglycosylase D
MQKKNNRIILALYALLVAASGCSSNRVLPHPPPSALAKPKPILDAGATIDDSGSMAEQLLPAYDDGNDTPPWNRYRSILDLPDPEHQTLEADGAETIPFAPHSPDEGDAGKTTGTHDLWDRLRAGYALPSYDNARVRAELGWYVDHPSYLARSIERARPYLRFIVEELETRHMPLEIALLPIVESAYQPFAYSQGRAAGLWQFIPATASLYGLRRNWWYDGRRDVIASTRAALDYLQYLDNYFNGDWLLALAAYNSGEGAVQRAIDVNAAQGKPTDFWSLKLTRETRAYVPKLLALSELFAHPQSYGIELEPIPDEPAIAQVDVGAQIDIVKAAQLADMSLDEFYHLNPAFNRWATDPDGPYHLVLPVDKVEDFSAKLSTLDPSERVSWTRHEVRPGETLGQIAKRYGVTVNILKQVNKLNGHSIHAGENLVVPSPSKPGAGESPIDHRTSAGPARVEHVVRNGDTLWSIARGHGVEVSKLAEWNTLSPDEILRPGQRLVIWEAERANSDTAARPYEGFVPVRDMVRRINYVVRKGDSLTRISQRFNVTVAELRKWNSLSHKAHIRPGQSLTLYVDVTRQLANL